MKRNLVLNSKIITAIVLLLAAPLLMARDELVIDIVDGVESALPIAVVPFRWEGTGPAPDTVVSLVIKDDLARSGQFRALKEADLIEQPTRLADIRFSTWRLLQVDYLVVGRVMPDGDGYAVEYQLIDVISTKRLQGFRFQVSKGKLRRTAHQIADRIFEEILGIPGAFNTLIAYVTQDERLTEAEYKLMVADADGFNPRQALSSSEPILSPAWSPDGTRLAYVSFQTGNSNVYVQQISTGSRERVASFQGINGAPSWSPDGKSLALALSRTGNLEIYVMDFATRSLRQLTKHRSIDTEPIWTPDGSRIIFTSDRGGRPQLYEIPVDGGRARRLTFDRDYNARASVSPDGKKIAMASGQNNDYRIAVLDKTSGRTQIVTPGFLDESPSFSPNGMMILYASHEGDQDILAAVSTDGRVRQRLILTDVDVREPAWSPRLR